MCCRGRHGRGICPKERFGATSRVNIFQAVSGCPTPDMANPRREWLAISRRDWKRRQMAIAPELWLYIAWRIAGCRGTPPSARSRSAILTSRGILKGPTVGLPAGLPLEDATLEPRPQE